MGVIEIFGVCKYPFLIFNIKEVIEMFKICTYAFLTWLIFSMNGVIGNVWGMGKSFKVCRYAFLFILKFWINRVCQKYLLYTSFLSCINTILSDNKQFSSFRNLFRTLLDGSIGINGGKYDGSYWLEQWGSVIGVWWDSCSVTNEFWKALLKLW